MLIIILFHIEIKMTRTNYEWYIEKNLDEYGGKLVDIDDNKVLDSDLKLDPLLKRVKAKYPKSRPLIGRIRNKLLRLHSS